MNRFFRIIFGIFVVAHLFFIFRYETPFPCEAASTRIFEVLAEDKVFGPLIMVGATLQGKDVVVEMFVEKISPLIQKSQGYNGCYKIALVGIPDEDKLFWSNQ